MKKSRPKKGAAKGATGSRLNAELETALGAELAALDADALFARMQALVDALPAMEEKGRRAQAAREAAKVDDLARVHRAQAATLEQTERALDVHSQARQEAIAAGDSAREQAERTAVMQLVDQRGLCLGAEQAAREALARALATSPFEVVEAAKAALLPKDELSALETEIATFERDYELTYAACQRTLDEDPKQLP